MSAVSFDPVRVRGILEKRMDRINAEASRELQDKYAYAANHLGNLFGEDELTRAHDKSVHELWDHAESINPILAYLDDRIWSEKTRDEKIWETMKDWDWKPGPEMLADVWLAAAMVDGEAEGFDARGVERYSGNIATNEEDK